MLKQRGLQDCPSELLSFISNHLWNAFANAWASVYGSSANPSYYYFFFQVCSFLRHLMPLMEKQQSYLKAPERVDSQWDSGCAAGFDKEIWASVCPNGFLLKGALNILAELDWDTLNSRLCLIWNMPRFLKKNQKPKQAQHWNSHTNRGVLYLTPLAQQYIPCWVKNWTNPSSATNGVSCLQQICGGTGWKLSVPWSLPPALTAGTGLQQAPAFWG